MTKVALYLELLKLLLPAFSLLHFQDVKPDSLAQWTALTHHHQVPQLKISRNNKTEVL